MISRTQKRTCVTQALHDARIPDAEIVVVARTQMDLAASLEGDSPVAVKFQLVFPATALIGEGVCPQERHRIDEAALHFGSHHASLADESHRAALGRMNNEC